MMTMPLKRTTNRNAAQIDLNTLFKKAVWLFIVTLSICYSLVGSADSSHSVTGDAQRWIYVYLNFLSFMLAVGAGAIIYFRSPGSTMAFMTSVMLVTFTSTESGIRFWSLLFTGVPFWKVLEIYETQQMLAIPTVWFNLALFLDVLYMGLLTGSLAYVLLSFPEGRLVSRRTRWFFSMLVAFELLFILFVGGMCAVDTLGEMSGGLSITIYLYLDNARAVLLLLLAAWPILRLRRITDPVQRQQLKWFGGSLAAMTFVYAAYPFVPLEAALMDLGMFFLLLVCTCAFIFSLFIAIMRFRLWDMNFMFSKALVYSALTAVLGGVGFIGAVVNNFVAENLVDSSSPLGGVAVLLVITALFNPIREHMQAFVDRHFKPEEVDFSAAIVEIAPDAQLMLTSGEILKILVQQTTDQLDLLSATVYLRWADGQLIQTEPVARNPLAAHLLLDEKSRARLEKGNVSAPDEGSPFSLYVPLVLTRAARPDLLGVLALGPRRSGEGYPTPLLRSLKKLGGDAGRALYLAQLRERLGTNPVERLAAIGRELKMERRTA